MRELDDVKISLIVRGVAKWEGEGPGGPETPNPIPLKLLRIKRVRTRCALRNRNGLRIT